jgi:hypothetical protein
MEQKQREQIFDKIAENINDFAKTQPQKDKNFNGLVFIGNVEQSEINTEVSETEKPVKRIVAVVGKREDVMNTLISAMNENDDLYEVMKEAVAFLMAGKFKVHTDKLKHIK